MHRRQLLLLGARGVAASALFPWLSRASAQVPRTPRLILFYTPHGTVWDRFRPSGGVTNSMILAPLARHEAKVNVLDGLRLWSAWDYRVPHTFDLPLLWTGSPLDTRSTTFERQHGSNLIRFGWNLGPSVDQAIADRLQVTTPFRTIELGVGCQNAHPKNRMIYAAPGQPRHPIDQPGLAYDQIFGGLEDAQPDLSALRRRSVLDTVLEDLQSVRGRLTSSDRARLDAHMTSVREVERSLGATGDVCTPPNRPPAAGLEVAIEQQLQLLSSAIACERTHIASMQIRIADNDGSLYPSVGIAAQGHHSYSHDRSGTAQNLLARLYTWYAERFASLLDRLDAIPDGDGLSVLDNSLVVWGSEIGTGYNHDVSNIPFVVAGGAAGRMRGGRYIDLRGRNLQHNRLLVDCMRAMGLPAISSFGTVDDGTGGVPGLLSG